MRSALGATGLSLLTVLILASPVAAGSILPQIDRALDARAEGEITHSPLGKHYVEIAPGVYFAVKGKKERREIRMARWIEMLDGDRARIYAEEGFPPSRHLESTLGIQTEHWSYPERGVTYVFQDGSLVDVLGS